PGGLGRGRQPRVTGLPEPAQLLPRDHLQRIAEPGTVLRLHLAEDEPPAAAQHQIELVAARPDVRAEDAVAAQPVVEPGPPLGPTALTPGRWPRARLRRAGSRGRERSGGGSR